MADTDNTGSELSPSDLELAITTIQKNPGLVGYRNLLSYTSALGIKVFPKEEFDVDAWTPIGAGSYSVTWKAEIISNSRKVVAIKQPVGSFTRASSDVENSVQHQGLAGIIQEIRILANPKLRDHPNLPHILSVFFREEERPVGIRPCVLFDLAVSDLQQYLTSQPSVSAIQEEVIRFASNVANGLGALHACGLVHGDIKPENVLLFDRNGVLTAAVADLGTCGTSSQVSGAIPGSIRFCAPEYHSGSPFASFVNKPSRDVYNFGLILWSMLMSCKELPFPSDKQFEIQHDYKETLRSLLTRVPEHCMIASFRDSIVACVKPDPTRRPSIFEPFSFGDPGSSSRDIAELSVTVRALAHMPLPTHLTGKLRDEYARTSDATNVIRCAVTLAGLYSGVIWPPITQPWNSVAKIQWLLKVVELGSYSAISILLADNEAIIMLEESGQAVPHQRHPSFESPQIDEKGLLLRLKGFAEMPDADSANILVWLGGGSDWDTFERRLRRKKDAEDEVKTGEENPRQLTRFVLLRHIERDIVDSAAWDINLGQALPINLSILNDVLEEFIILAEEYGLKPRDQAAQNCMAMTIFYGSFDIMRYLMVEYEVHPNDEWEEMKMSHLNLAVLFNRRVMVEFLLEHGGTIGPVQTARDKNLPATVLHLACRRDDPELIVTLCEHLKVKGQLRQILESKNTTGPMEGWTAAHTAACSESWKTLAMLLDYGANPNCVLPEESSMIEIAVQPRSPAVPISVLKKLLECGAQADYEYPGSPLQWAVGSSNVLAVFYLLLHGVAVSDAALKDAEENIDEFDEVLPVLDEDGKESKDGWENMCGAASFVLKLLQIGHERRKGWEQLLEETVQGASQDLKGKLWICDNVPTSYMIEVRVPD